jgi:hypothetical protein
MATIGTADGAIDKGAANLLTISGQTMTDSTRYLCAAAHLDGALRNWVFKHVLYVEHKAIGPSHGIDLPTVVRHCLAARRRKTRRNVALVVLLVLGWIALYVLPDYALLITFIASIAAWLVILAEMWITRFTIVASHLTRGRSGAKDYNDISLSNAQQRRLDELAHLREGNTIAYSGFSPFVGAGVKLDAWSFAINIGNGKEEIGASKRHTPRPFQVSDLYNYVAKEVGKLPIKGLSTEDKLFVNGRDIRDNQAFLPSPYSAPVTDVNQRLLSTFVENPSQSVRHYKCLRVESWKGELVLSIFLRFVLVGRNLFAEASYHILPPLKERYRKVDAITPIPTWRQRGQTLLQSLVATPFLWVLAPVFLLSLPLQAFGRWQERRREGRLIKQNPTFDYGAATSLREHASSDSYHQYFQLLDKEMYAKLIERELLDSIITFLDDHDIDTSDLKERQTMIMNSGTLIAGNVKGLVQGSNPTVDMSFGKMARRVGRAATGGGISKESA